MEFTYEKLPLAVSELAKELSEVKELILSLKTQSEVVPDKYLKIQEATELLNISIHTIYSKVSRGELPSMKRGKRLYFSRLELLEYIANGRKLSNADIEKKRKIIYWTIKRGFC